MQLNGFSSAVGLMGLKRGQHQQQFMMMIATILLVEKTVISFIILIETSANQDTKYNYNHRILEAFFDIWLVVTCKWIGQEKSLTCSEKNIYGTLALLGKKGKPFVYS